MATMKITVDELKYRKAIYTKAAKNLREIIAVVKKAGNSIGNDRMFAEARNSLRKLAENMDRRATVLEALAEALVYSADTYKGAQTHSVSQISDYRAHKTDFYGKAVHVSAAAGGAAAAVAGGSTTPTGSAGTVSTGQATQTAASTYSPSTGGGAAETASAGLAGAQSSSAGTSAENTTVNVTNIVYNNTENVVINTPAGDIDAAASVSAEIPSVGEVAADIPSGAEGSGAGANIGMFAAGVAAAAGAAGAAFGIGKVVKKKQAGGNSIDSELEEAKRKLKAIEDEENELRASMAQNEIEENEEI